MDPCLSGGNRCSKVGVWLPSSLLKPPSLLLCTKPSPYAEQRLAPCILGFPSSRTKNPKKSLPFISQTVSVLTPSYPGDPEV